MIARQLDDHLTSRDRLLAHNPGKHNNCLCLLLTPSLSDIPACLCTLPADYDLGRVTKIFFADACSKNPVLIDIVVLFVKLLKRTGNTNKMNDFW